MCSRGARGRGRLSITRVGNSPGRGGAADLPSWDFAVKTCRDLDRRAGDGSGRERTKTKLRHGPRLRARRWCGRAERRTRRDRGLTFEVACSRPEPRAVAFLTCYLRSRAFTEGARRGVFDSTFAHRRGTSMRISRLMNNDPLSLSLPLSGYAYTCHKICKNTRTLH